MHIKISRNVQGRYNDYSTSKVTGNKRKLDGEKIRQKYIVCYFYKERIENVAIKES